MRLQAYAKINLSLAVTGVREDGYHTLDTVMQSVSLCDELEIKRCDGGNVRFFCTDKLLETPKNLCVRAADAFFAACGYSHGVEIRLDKQIPYGAGLGGGSADAAAVLRGLQALFGEPLMEAELYRLAATLGADVPFCLHGGKCRCTGIGEILQPLAEDAPYPLVIAKGASGLSTPDMYRRLDEMLARDAARVQAAANWFEPVAEEVLTDVTVLKKLLLANGAQFSQMTGSGSAVFGRFVDAQTAENAAAACRREGFYAQACESVM